jgi:hypothetical protein
MIGRPFPRTHPLMRTTCIWHPSAAREGFVVALFRRSFRLDAPLAAGELLVTADERFILHLDGQVIARGPARSDGRQWYVQPVAIGPLPAGEHVLAATVWHFGDLAALAQTSGKAFFLLHAEGSLADGRPLSDLLDSGPQWRCLHDTSRTPASRDGWPRAPFVVVGTGERIDAAAAPWGFDAPGFDDMAWQEPLPLGTPQWIDYGRLPIEHILVPSPIGPMEETPQRFARVAEAPPQHAQAAAELIARDQPMTVPANTELRLLLDRGELTNAYNELTVSGGRGSFIQTIAVEAMMDEHRRKGNRDETAGKQALGHLDELLPDGGAHRVFRTLWWRSYRYLELTIRTAGQPLVLDSIRPVFTGYPLTMRATFAAGPPRADHYARMWDITWRTARLCAHETYFDCPHYEQFQYVGDTRIQAIYSYLMANDDALARKAIDDFHTQRGPEGLVPSRAPGRLAHLQPPRAGRECQIIPSFSLYWVGMLDDFRIYRGDAEFLRPYLPAAREQVDWFARQRRPDGMPRRIEYWPFFDWVTTWHGGDAPQDDGGGSSLFALLAARACGWMASLERFCGHKPLAAHWRMLASELIQATMRACWDQTRGLLADTSSRRSYSEHAQVEAVLAGAIAGKQARAALATALGGGEGITPSDTFYYRYYTISALVRAGMPRRFFELLKLWEETLAGSGLTTWPETRTNTRSDCHAWSVTPAIEMLRLVLGVQPSAAAGDEGFARVVLRPTLGPLAEASGTVPTPRGDVRVQLRKAGRKIAATVQSPVPVIVPSQRCTLPAGSHQLLL